MTDTTNISDLPTATGNNITLEMKERTNQQGMIMNGPVQPSAQNSTNQMANNIVSGIQNASASNMTRLPARDIPMMTQEHTQDPQSQPNYVPPQPQHIDYIAQHDSIQSMLQKKQKNHIKEDRLEYIYDELQTPIFVMILYLLFQLPSFHKLLYRNIPSLFSNDGHPYFTGYLFKTFLFGVTFYLIQRGIKYLSQT